MEAMKWMWRQHNIQVINLARHREADGLDRALGVQLVAASNLALSNVAATLGHPGNSTLRVGRLELADVERPGGLIDNLVVSNVAVSLKLRSSQHLRSMHLTKFSTLPTR